MENILWIVFLTATALQFVYLVFIFGRLAFFYHHPQKEECLQNKEGVTVVVVAKDEEYHLKELVPLLFEQEFPDFEVLVVDDRSSDGTSDLLKCFSDIYPGLKTVSVKYTPKHVTAKKYALTLGIKAAKNNIILLTDADCRPVSEQWIQLMTSPIRTDNKIFALGHGSYLSQPGLLNKMIQFETLLTSLYYLSFCLWKAPFMGVGRNLCYRKSYFLQQNAFKDLWHINGGDDDLFVNRYANKHNTSVVIHPNSITVSFPKTNLKDYILQKNRHFHAGKYYKPKDKLKLGIYSLSHLLFWLSASSLMLLSNSWEPIAIVMGLVLARALLQYTIIRKTKKKLEGVGKVLWTMFFDLMYLSYFWVVGTKGYLSKTVKWK